MLCNSEKSRLHKGLVLRGGGSVIKVWLTINQVLSLVTMAKLGILVAVAIFLRTVSATSVSTTI